MNTLAEAKAAIEQAQKVVQQARAQNDKIRELLEHLNKTQTVETNEVLIIKKHIDTMRKNMAKMSVEIKHPDNLTEHQKTELARVQSERLNAPPIPYPNFMKKLVESEATTYKGPRGLEVTVKI